jgi:hypothetical protein
LTRDAGWGSFFFFFETTGDGGEDTGGVFDSSAPSTIFGGGCALGDMIIPGAFEGSRGLRDQTAHDINGWADEESDDDSTGSDNEEFSG